MFTKASVQSGIIILIGLFAGGMTSRVSAAPAGGESHVGRAVPIGRGTAHVVVGTDVGVKPQSVSVVLSEGALKGLPTRLSTKNAEGSWVYAVPMPAGPPRTGYSEVVIDWNPHGHPPPHIYTVPHFDFHFYMISPEAVEKVHFTGPSDPAAKVLDAAIVPSDYQVIPETVVDKMGVHAVDTLAPEFHGKPFTATFIYGYYQNRLVFLEPMVTRAFLLTKPDFRLPVRTPARYSTGGYYPTSYGVRYDAVRHNYVIELLDLKQWVRHEAARKP